MTFFGSEGSLGWTTVGSIHCRTGQGDMRGLRWNPTEQLKSAPHPASVDMSTAVTPQPQLQGPWKSRQRENRGFHLEILPFITHCYPHSLACGALPSLISIWVTAFCTTSNFYLCFSLRGENHSMLALPAPCDVRDRRRQDKDEGFKDNPSKHKCQFGKGQLEEILHRTETGLSR